MTLRQPLPRIWLLTDERLGDAVLGAVSRLPGGAGIVFRHYSLADAPRRALFDRVQAQARLQGLMLLLAGSRSAAIGWGADGWHGSEEGAGLRSAPVHNLRELRQAEAGGAALLFLSPVFATRSHPGAATLGPRRFAALAAKARRPVIALGGVTPTSAPLLLRLGAYGWGGIDTWAD